MEDTRLRKYVKLTPLQETILTILKEAKLPLMTAEEICKVHGRLAPCQLGGPLGGLRERGLIDKVKLPTKELNIILVPGRVVGLYDRGMVPVIKTKFHWFTRERKDEVPHVRKTRQLQAKKAFAKS